jgi:DNA repair exonuclease SbcCD ATPase subunit
MSIRFLRQSAVLLTVLMLISICLVDADGQTRRKRRPRRVNRPVVTNPAIAAPGEEQTPSTDTERVISTADETPSNPDATTGEATKTKAKKDADQQEVQQTINSLSNQVKGLNDKLSQMQENDKSLMDMERLTRAEQRAENLRAQQIDVESKLADLTSTLEQTEFALRPENIERAAAGYGTTRPEEARDARRRALENERKRLQAQIGILETSRTRLEQSLITADAEVDNLRRKLEQQKQQEAAGTAPVDARPTNKATRP